MQSASNITNSNKYEDVVDKVTVIENNVLTLQSYTGSLHNFNNTSQASSSFTISSLPTMVTVSVMLLRHMAKSECKQFDVMRNAQLTLQPFLLILLIRVAPGQ